MKFGIPNSIISTWQSQKTNKSIFTEFESRAVNVRRKNLKEGEYSDMEGAFLQWVKDVRKRPFPFS